MSLQRLANYKSRGSCFCLWKHDTLLPLVAARENYALTATFPEGWDTMPGLKTRLYSSTRFTFPFKAHLEQLEVRRVLLAGDHFRQHLRHDFDVASHYVQLTAQPGDLRTEKNQGCWGRGAKSCPFSRRGKEEVNSSFSPLFTALIQTEDKRYVDYH